MPILFRIRRGIPAKPSERLPRVRLRSPRRVRYSFEAARRDGLFLLLTLLRNARGHLVCDAIGGIEFTAAYPFQSATPEEICGRKIESASRARTSPTRNPRRRRRDPQNR